MITYLLLAAGFILLIKGADLLVDGAASIARKLKVSDISIGLTIVAFGTSMPELVVNIFASAQGNPDIAIGNILGSNIANIFLILGISAIIYPLTVKKNTVWKEIPFSLLAAIVVGILASDMLIDGRDFSELSRGDGFILIGFFAIFMYYIVSISKDVDAGIEADVKEMATGKSTMYLIGGLIGLVAGGKLIVDSAVEIASSLGLSEAFIGLTVVAVGTSLPELATSAVAAYKKNVDIAVGNIVGSNIFNVFWILGISSIIKPLPFNTTSIYDLGMTLLASILLFMFLFVGRRHTIDKGKGIIFVLIYIGYIVFLSINSSGG
jgi:cation:H+ antiporter